MPADLSPDEIVQELDSDPDQNPDLIALAGFLGEAHGEGRETRVRLYADPSLNRWVEIEHSAIEGRRRLAQEPGSIAPLTIVWVRGEVLRQEFEGVPERLQLEFLNDRAELWIEPPRSMLEVVEYMKMPAEYFYGMTRRTRRPTWHC